MNTLVTIILIVFAVLQIILFFKLWRMANNISKIRESQEDNNLKQMSVTAALYGNTTLAEKLIEQSLYNSARRLVLYGWGKEEYLSKMRSVLKQHKDLCSRLGLQMPDTTKYENWDTAKPLFNNNINKSKE
ncbi:MAG: hypothetical protein PHO36_15635 [Parabacteroides sp.]|nr:hypothetical protein [Parabacteroides sp.]